MDTEREHRFRVIFTAQVQLDGINPFVDVPDEARRQLGPGPNVPVLVRVARSEGGVGIPGPPEGLLDQARLRSVGRLSEDGEFRTTIVPRSGGRSRLFLDTAMRKSANAQVGDHVAVALEPDLEPRELAVPTLLQVALDDDPSLDARWKELTPSRRREILSYLNSLRTEASLERNVTKVLKSLSG